MNFYIGEIYETLPSHCNFEHRTKQSGHCNLKAYDGILRNSATESIAKYTLNFIDSRYPLQNSPLPIHAMCPAFQPLLEAPLELTFWNLL